MAGLRREQAGQTVGALVAVAGITTEGEDGWYVDSSSGKVAHFSFAAAPGAAARRASVGEGGERAQDTSPPLPMAALEGALAAARAPAAMGLPVAFAPQRDTSVPRHALLFMDARGELSRLQPAEARELERRRMGLALGACERGRFGRGVAEAAAAHAEEQGALLPSPLESAPPWYALQLRLAGLAASATAELQLQLEEAGGAPPGLELRLSAVAPDASFVEIWRSAVVPWAPGAAAIEFPPALLSRVSLFGAPAAAAAAAEEEDAAEDEAKGQEDASLWRRPLALECVSVPALLAGPAGSGESLVGRCYTDAAAVLAAAAAAASAEGAKGGALPPLCAAVPDGEVLSYTEVASADVVQVREMPRLPRLPRLPRALTCRPAPLPFLHAVLHRGLRRWHR